MRMGLNDPTFVPTPNTRNAQARGAAAIGPGRACARERPRGGAATAPCGRRQLPVIPARPPAA
jgi:hypothetical protein